MRSTAKESTDVRIVLTRPPTRSLPSSTVTVWPKLRNCLAAARPLAPAPMTRMRCGVKGAEGEVIVTGTGATAAGTAGGATPQVVASGSAAA